jgi:hypothetical protein
VDRLRKDIDIPRPLLEKWRRGRYFGPSFRDDLLRIYQHRKMVLAIFDELVLNERGHYRLQ